MAVWQVATSCVFPITPFEGDKAISVCTKETDALIRWTLVTLGQLPGNEDLPEELRPVRLPPPVRCSEPEKGAPLWKDSACPGRTEHKHFLGMAAAAAAAAAAAGRDGVSRRGKFTEESAVVER